MDTKLTKEDCEFILESLKYTRLKFEEYSYPTQEYKLKRIAEVNAVAEKVSHLKKMLS